MPRSAAGRLAAVSAAADSAGPRDLIAAESVIDHGDSRVPGDSRQPALQHSGQRSHRVSWGRGAVGNRVPKASTPNCRKAFSISSASMKNQDAVLSRKSASSADWPLAPAPGAVT